MDESGKKVVRVGLKPIDPAELILGDPVLSRCALVRALGDDAPALLRAAGVRRLAPGAHLFDAGAPASEVYLVLKGRVTVLSGAGSETVAAAELSRGELCGAGAALDAGARTVGAVAAEEVEIVILDAGALEPYARTRPEVRSVLEAAREREQGAADDLAAFLDRW